MSYNIVFTAGLDAYHFNKARAEFSEKDHLNAIADRIYQTKKYDSYSAAMGAAIVIYDYQVMLAEGVQVNRDARKELQRQPLPNTVGYAYQVV